MAEIISFGKLGGKKTSVFKLVWMEIVGLSLFTKLTIIIILLVPIIVTKTWGELFQSDNYASTQTPTVSEALPPNCHLAVDFSECSGKPSCQPKPKLICDEAQE
ncbi:MAG: hypothetical protein ACD_37C00265G0001 [uncultured bacterium]|nr:MAG: hypothetical protein ACD_37C00265G0001 [uncultured bacterium]KKR17578.1 MAG: hypothetical protein UT44_C0006G0005 [Candidatus Levybacteria bacterium GW2011_GWA1_39_32]KKR73562.1 MAG: hypothetical protein UU15_C0007G0008 [Candidatus Levybacteria bacterium GW2011_GWC2_40_7]OGH20311.1 MAG: hypothetical protein A2695_02515 [Candidatus Levybacteria bacterium RIFCSPHIGHO2_01_FULL_40_83]OGH24619.1 MAG: hypothetical protein A3D82_01075 [Candidatus Levybacteria bacterium RIFCSPHIGHO2_02_FULL_40_